MEESVNTRPNNIFARIAKITEDLGVIEKSGRNTFQNYDYVKEADIVAALRPLMLKHGVVMVMQTSPATTEDLSKGKLTNITAIFKFICTDNAQDYVQVSVPGQGSDNGDKGAYKAITGAKKYALLTTFMIATGDDPEKDDKPSVVSSKSKAKDF